MQKLFIFFSQLICISGWAQPESYALSNSRDSLINLISEGGGAGKGCRTVAAKNPVLITPPGCFIQAVGMADSVQTRFFATIDHLTQYLNRPPGEEYFNTSMDKIVKRVEFFIGLSENEMGQRQMFEKPVRKEGVEKEIEKIDNEHDKQVEIIYMKKVGTIKKTVCGEVYSCLKPMIKKLRKYVYQRRMSYVLGDEFELHNEYYAEAGKTMKRLRAECRADESIAHVNTNGPTMMAVLRKSTLRRIDAYEKHLAGIVYEWEKITSSCFDKVFKGLAPLTVENDLPSLVDKGICPTLFIYNELMHQFLQIGKELYLELEAKEEPCAATGKMGNCCE